MRRLVFVAIMLAGGCELLLQAFYRLPDEREIAAFLVSVDGHNAR